MSLVSFHIVLTRYIDEPAQQSVLQRKYQWDTSEVHQQRGLEITLYEHSADMLIRIAVFVHDDGLSHVLHEFIR